MVVASLIMSCGVGSAQPWEQMGAPFLTNYPPGVYNQHSQTWDVVQDNRGMMYFGNVNGVLVYDGLEWSLVELPGKTTVRSLAVDAEGRVYVGSYNDLGYLRPDEKGLLEFVSLSHLVPEKYKPFYDIWNIHLVGDSVYFQTDRKILRYREGTLTVFPLYSPGDEHTIEASFSHQGSCYFVDGGKGLYRIAGDSLIRMASGDVFPPDVQTVMSVGKGRFIFIAGDRLYRLNLDGMRVDPLNSPDASYFIKNQLYRGLVRAGDHLAVGTALGGVVLMNAEGEIVKIIDEDDGLLTGSVYKLYLDRQNNLWVATSGGISRIELSSPITYWNNKHGLRGYVSDIYREGRRLYIATENGIYQLNEDGIARFSDYKGQCWSLGEYSDPVGSTHLLVGTNNGLFEMQNATMREIWNRGNVYNVLSPRQAPEVLFVALNDGLQRLTYREGVFRDKGRVEGVHHNVRTMAQDRRGNLWLATFRNGVYRLQLSDDQQKVLKVDAYASGSGFASLRNINVYRYTDRLLFAAEDGIYRYKPAEDHFMKDTAFMQGLRTTNRGIFAMDHDADGRVWLSSLNNRRGSVVHGSPSMDGGMQWQYTPWQRIPEMMVLDVYKDTGEVVWFGGSEGLFRYQPNPLFQKRGFTTHIRKVELDGDSTLFHGAFFRESGGRRRLLMSQPKSDVEKVDYQNNTLVFTFASTGFVAPGKLEYSHYLEGFNSGWSSWQEHNSVRYTNLKGGDYVFHVRARNIYGWESREATYKFAVTGPWYGHPVAITLFIVVGVGLIWLLFRLYASGLKRSNLLLGSMVEERTQEIEKQKEEIKTQAEQLSNTNKELAKLSVVARETDNAVMILNQEGRPEWVNAGFTRLYGYRLDDLKDSEQSGQLLKNIREPLESCLQKKVTKTFESMNQTREGDTIWTHTTLTPITGEHDDVEKVIAIDSNITEMKMAEEEIKRQKSEIEAQRDYLKQQKEYIEQQNQELEKHRTRLEQLVDQRTKDLKKAKEKAEEADKLKSSFLANMSHEIRTPMNAVVGFSNLLNDKDINYDIRRELINQINIHSHTLLNLIDNIIDLARIDSGQLRVKNVDCDMDAILEELKDAFSETVAYKDVDLAIHQDPDLSGYQIVGDPYRVKQVFSNLIDNAIKFTDSGIVEFGYELKEYDGVQQARCFVSDSGIGISKKQQRFIFQRFTKVEYNREKLYRGAGLGLTISKILIEMMGGKIWLQSIPHEGSVFYFTLPLK